MPPAANLVEAASNAFDNIHTMWLANTLKTQVTTFATYLLTIFPEQQDAGHPVSNWLTLLLVASSQMPSSNVSYQAMLMAADYMYRCCWMTNQLAVQSLVPNSETATVLSEYNLEIQQ